VVTHRTSGRTITEDTDMIKQVKYELAERQIAEFIEKMQFMGFEKREILTLIAKILEEMK